MPNKLIKDLIDKGAVTLKEQGYSIRSREYTLLTWKQFQEFCNKKGYVARSGVKVPIHAHHGLHSLRATVATKLLSADVSPDIIFSFLGHSDRESLGHYIRLDIENLRECALSFEDGDLL